MHYFYGVKPPKTSGHFLYDINGRRLATYPTHLPSEVLDGVFVGRDDGLYKPRLWHTSDWTVLAMHDRSGDKRPGSNSVFLLNGHFKCADAWSVASEYFPEVCQRIEAARNEFLAAHDNL